MFEHMYTIYTEIIIFRYFIIISWSQSKVKMTMLNVVLVYLLSVLFK